MMISAKAGTSRSTDLAGISRSGVRGGLSTTTELAAAQRDVIERFYYHLRSLPKGTALDFEAFFPKGNLGNLSQLKPADLAAHGAAVLRGASLRGHTSTSTCSVTASPR